MGKEFIVLSTYSSFILQLFLSLIFCPPPCRAHKGFHTHLICVTSHTSKTSLILCHWQVLIRLVFKFSLHPLTSPPFSHVLISPAHDWMYLYTYSSIITELYEFMVLPPETAVAMERSHVHVFYDATCRQAPAGIFQCHPRQWEALYGDMSVPCLHVVLMKLGVGRVGSLVQVPGIPLNESASPHSNWLLPWELMLGFPSTELE